MDRSTDVWPSPSETNHICYRVRLQRAEAGPRGGDHTRVGAPRERVQQRDGTGRRRPLDFDPTGRPQCWASLSPFLWRFSNPPLPVFFAPRVAAPPFVLLSPLSFGAPLLSVAPLSSGPPCAASRSLLSAPPSLSLLSRSSFPAPQFSAALAPNLALLGPGWGPTGRPARPGPAPAPPHPAPPRPR